MGCLTDYIGIRWCGGTSSPPSSLYVNDLPGISLKQINSITDEENATFLSLWNNIQDRAERRFSLDVREGMSAKYQLKSLAQGVTLSRVVEDYTTNTYPNSTYLGISIELNSGDNLYTPSPLMQINVQSVSFYNPSGANTGLNSSVVFFDMDTNQILYQKSIVLGAGGWENYEINQSFLSTSTQNPLRIACVIDNAEQLAFVSQTLNSEIRINSCCQADINGMSIEGNQVYSESAESYGVTATFNVTCSWDSLICQNKNLFSRAFWYLCGIEFLTELIYSSVLTSWTTINLQKAKDLRAEYEVEYQKSLSQVASGMNLDCDCCLDCSGGVQIRTATQFF
jgi:hypothetical protein